VVVSWFIFLASLLRAYRCFHLHKEGCRIYEVILWCKQDCVESNFCGIRQHTNEKFHSSVRTPWSRSVDCAVAHFNRTSQATVFSSALSLNSIESDNFLKLSCTYVWLRLY